MLQLRIGNQRDTDCGRSAGKQEKKLFMTRLFLLPVISASKICDPRSIQRRDGRQTDAAMEKLRNIYESASRTPSGISGRISSHCLLYLASNQGVQRFNRW